MNQAQAEKTVLAVVLVTAAVVLHDNFKKTGKASPPVKSAVSFGLLAGALALGAEVAPAVVGPFALLVGLAVVLSRLPKEAAK